MRIDENIRRLLENEVKIHLAEIRFLYENWTINSVFMRHGSL